MSKDILQRVNPFASTAQQLLFRIGFVFLILLSIPFEPSWYKALFSIDFSNIGFPDFFLITRHSPGIVHLSDWGWASYAGWLITLLVSVVISAVWHFLDKKRTNYETLYYWGRVFLRYRLALGIIGYGIILLIPVQFPQPTISDLHSGYGDFLPWKIYYHTTAVASAGYRETIGAIEVIAGFLLLCRRSVLFGAIAIAFILINVVLANFAYAIGEHLYSSYLLLLALILIAHDLPRLYQLLVKEASVVAEKFEPVFTTQIKSIRRIARIAFTLFFLLFAGFVFKSYTSSNWPYPDQKGLVDEGIYNVSQFKLNDSLHAYSLTDPIRWQDVVFEKWNVVSVRKSQPVVVNLSGPTSPYGYPLTDQYAFEGNGARSFYTYSISGNDITFIPQNGDTDTLRFALNRPDASTIELTGIASKGDSLSLVLTKLNKEYLLDKGRRKPVTIQ